MPTPEAVAVLFAEEYRQENSGQLIAVGVWPPALTVEEFPWSELVAPMILWKHMEGEIDLELEIRGRSGAQFAHARFKTGVEDVLIEGLLSYLPLPARRITLSAPDIIEVAVRISGGPEEVIGMMAIQGEAPVAQKTEVQPATE